MIDAYSLGAGGAKGYGLALLKRSGVPIPQTVVVDLRRPNNKVFTSIDSSGFGWVLRASPVVDQRLFPKLSGMFSSVRFKDASDLFKAIEEVSESGTSPDVVARLNYLGIKVPVLVGLLQPYWIARLGGIAHIYPSEAIEIAFLEGHPAVLASGEQTGHMVSAFLPYTGFVEGLVEFEAEVARHGGHLHKVLTALNSLNELHVALEVEWLVTIHGQLFALQAQELHDRGYGS